VVRERTCGSTRSSIEEAKKACELTEWKIAGFVDTLCVAFADTTASTPRAISG
jgi:hypothetical protein